MTLGTQHGERMMADCFVWTQRGIDHYMQSLQAELWAKHPAKAGGPICSELLVEIMANGDTPQSMRKAKYATGTAPGAPEHLLAAQDGWQAAMKWPLATADEAALLEELKAAAAPLFEGLASAAFEDVAGSLRLLRFLRGFEYSVPTATVAVRRMLQLRKEYGMDAQREAALAALAAAGPAGELLPTPKSQFVHQHLPYVRTGVANEAGAPGIGPVCYLPLARQDGQSCREWPSWRPARPLRRTTPPRPGCSPPSTGLTGLIHHLDRRIMTASSPMPTRPS